MELTVHRDKILRVMGGIKEREAGRSSEAGEDREEIGSLLELTGINKKAFSFIRALDKMAQDKRDDVLRSLDPLLEMMDRHWNGNATPDMFEATEDEPVEAAALPAPSYAADFDPGEDDTPSDLDAEQDAFDKHLAEVAAQ